jgi:four helix bundle protein
MRGVKSYQDLVVWTKALDLVEMVYRVSASFPTDERFGMTSQVRRAATSVASNIAEGAERRGSKEFLHFLGLTSDSLAETESILILAQRSGMLSPDQATPLLAHSAEVGRMLSGLKRSINARV